MKKFFTLLTLLVCLCTGAWADAVTIGLTQTVTDEGSTHTIGDATYTGTTNVTVAKSIGSNCGDGYTGKTVTVGNPSVGYSATKAFRKTQNGSSFLDAQYVGYTITVASGYKVSLTNLNAEFWSSDATMTWKVTVLNPSGTQIYGSSTAQNNSNNKGTITVASPSGLTNLSAGTYTVKLQMYQSGGNKYFVVPSLTFNATVEEDNSTSYTVTASAGAGGTVSPSGESNVVEGGSINITATPNTGYGFLNWTIDGVENASTANPYTFNNVTANHTIAAVFKQLYTVSYNVASENKGSSTNVLTTEYANVSNKWTAPANYYTYSEGKTLTKWNDGANDYTPGTEYTLAGNITIAPVYTANDKYVGDFTVETTVTWPFATNDGAPKLNSEGNTQYYVQQTTIAGNNVDVPIFVNTENGYGISGKKGKFVGSATNAQVNAGTVFKIPAVKGMVVKYMTSSTTAVGNIGFTDNTSNLGGDGTALTTPSVISSDNKTISYTYTGTANFLYLVDKEGGKYPTGISVTYPEKQTKYLAPTITVGDFNFTSHAYPVTITAVEGTLEVSTDGTNYTAQTSPYEVNVTSTTHYYAKATGASYDPSDVVDKNVVNTFDGAKKYVAWVYESNYANAPSNYNIATDAIHTALGTVYNVVNVDIKDYKSAITDEQKTALNGNLDDADLVVISEAVGGASKGTIALKDIVGAVPMLSMKLFAYSAGRWAWGSPANKGTAVADVTITPASKLYKVLNGVTFDDDNVALFDYPNTQNHIQYVDSWTAEPAGDVVLANVSSKPAMHASTSQKYFALGLSCDDFTKYNANAVTIVKNAAAMLIAGEDLDEVTAVSITPAYAKTTYITPKALDFSGVVGLTAYVATDAKTAGVTMTKVTTVPAGTPLLLVGTASTDYNVPVIASASAPATNYLQQGDGTTEFDGSTYDYILGSDGKFHQINSGTVATTKAYLHLGAAPSGARELSIIFDDETTGVNEVRGQKEEVRDDFFDLQGRKVAQPTKGLYIVNGKKVIVK